VEHDVQFVDIGGQKTRVVDRVPASGSSASVVVLHGWGGRIESMSPVIECLARNFRVVALDLPGFGESPVPDSAWGTHDYGDYVYRVMREVGVEHAHFVGHSFGAKTALYLAATNPAAVDKLVAVASSGLRQAPSLKARGRRLLSKAARAAGSLGSPGRTLRDAVYARVASEDYKQAGELRPILVKVVNEDLSELLPGISAPTLLVWGTADDAVPLAHARTMERLIPDAGLVTFEGAGHFAYLEQRDRFCTVVRHFLRS
jgi:pimeloyl-ACP methyl ester carboxylesterase